MNEEQWLLRNEPVKRSAESEDRELNIESVESLTDLIDQVSRGAFTRTLALRDIRKVPSAPREDDRERD